jgi:hypothetical protein
MKSGFLYGVLFLVVLLSVSGCTKSVRYSQDEIKDFPPEVQEQIKQGTVAMGMTVQQVRFAWGPPSEINVLQPSEDGKPREEWIYSSFLNSYMQKRLLFVDGKLVDIFPEPKQ